jgi:outer membrane protein OmpA-like peptidoglycan-associated protein
MRPVVLFALLFVLGACSHLGNEPPPVYIVFFHQSSAEITPESRTTIAQAAAAIRRTHPAGVAIASGVAIGDNLKLAEPRFNSIRQALIAQGVDGDHSARAALPDAKLKVGATGDQRVEILLMPNP